MPFIFFFMHMKTNEGMLDRLIRWLIAVLVLVWWYMWLAWTLQIIAYVVGLVTLITSITGFCSLYALFKINTNKNKPIKPLMLVVWIILIAVIGWIFAFLSNFFSRKFFLEDFAHMNDNYKQLLFNSGKEKRTESIAYYDKLIPAYDQFQKKYTKYQPYFLKKDTQFVGDLVVVANLLIDIKEAVYSGNLLITHTKLEGIRPIFQEILKRNGISMLAITLVDFHDIMEEIIAWADAKDSPKIINTYPRADEKLKEVEAELNDEGIQAIRKNLDTILEMANSNQVELLWKQAQDLKASFVKVYLIKG